MLMPKEPLSVNSGDIRGQGQGQGGEDQEVVHHDQAAQPPREEDVPQEEVCC